LKIVSTLKTVTRTEVSRLKELLEGPQSPPLVNAIENARVDWQQALRELDHIDGAMAEYVIFKINAAERRYMALLEQAKKEGVTAWSNTAGFLPASQICSEDNTGEVENTPICTG
jgi:hypothetical protein